MADPQEPGTRRRLSLRRFVMTGLLALSVLFVYLIIDEAISGIPPTGTRGVGFPFSFGELTTVDTGGAPFHLVTTFRLVVVGFLVDWALSWMVAYLLYFWLWGLPRTR